ncbi:hypothetical protein B4W75_03205 [Staphylococcus intermedius]|nr:hypothetical protein B4W75_03205 [Staphylococcus intermedius]
MTDVWLNFVVTFKLIYFKSAERTLAFPRDLPQLNLALLRCTFEGSQIGFSAASNPSGVSGSSALFINYSPKHCHHVTTVFFPQSLNYVQFRFVASGVSPGLAIF